MVVDNVLMVALKFCFCFFFIGSFFFKCTSMCVCVKNCGNTRHNNFQFSTHSEMSTNKKAHTVKKKELYFGSTGI